jgi:hypothetical protein
MTPTPHTVSPVIAAALARWHHMLATQEMGLLVELLHPEVVFRSPMAHRPYAGSLAVGLILKTVSTIFQDFQYHQAFYAEDGLHVVLEFSASVDGKSLKGIDMIGFNEFGQIVDFEVMIRPFNALSALGQAMAERVGATLAAHKIS